MDIYSTVAMMKQERKTIYDLKIRVTFYARVSTTRDEQDNSIESQITYFSDMIKKNSNWEYVEGYADRIRGESAVNRTEFMRMIEDGKNGKFDLVLTKEISRFARNTIDSLTYTRELLKAGVGVLFQNDNICTIDTDSELRLTIMSSIATDEVRKLSDRIRWGQKRAIENGHVIGNNRIFGYEKKDCKLVINEAEAQMVRLIFDLYSTGKYSVKKIEQIIYDKGYRGRNDNRIHHNTISGIIQNPKYKGYYCGNKVKISDYRTREQRFLPQEEWIMYKDESGEIVPAIVDEDLWDRCNVLFKERSETVKKRGHSYKSPSVFSGKIVCTDHDCSYWRTSYSNSTQKGNSIYQWICGTKRRFGTNSCKSFPIMENELYQIMSDCSQKISFQFKDNIDEFLKPFLSSNNTNATKKQIDELNNLLKREKTKKEKLLDLYTDGVIDKKEFSERNQKLSSSVTDILSQITRLKESCEENATVSKIKTIKTQIEKICTDNGDLTKEQIDQFVFDLVERIQITPVNKNLMNVTIALKTGNCEKFDYSKEGRNVTSISCLGNTTNVMIPNQQYTFTRISRRMEGHIHKITLTVKVIF